MRSRGLPPSPALGPSPQLACIPLTSGVGLGPQEWPPLIRAAEGAVRPPLAQPRALPTKVQGSGPYSQWLGASQGRAASGRVKGRRSAHRTCPQQLRAGGTRGLACARGRSGHTEAAGMRQAVRDREGAPAPGSHLRVGRVPATEGSAVRPAWPELHRPHPSCSTPHSLPCHSVSSSL